MDTNQSKLTNHYWNHEISMEDHIFYDQNLFSNSIWLSNHNFPLQTHNKPGPSNQVPFSTLFSDQIRNHIEEEDDEPEEELGAMKEMMYKIASMQPVDIDPATIRRPKRRNIRISDDPQSVAARQRRERIREKIRILRRLVPGGTKMDTASMLDEAIRYVKFLKRQIRLLQSNNNNNKNQNPTPSSIGDWQVANTNKSLGSSTSSSIEPQSQPAGHELVNFGGNGAYRLWFNHNEVISE